jgi:hypothetical protein
MKIQLTKAANLTKNLFCVSKKHLTLNWADANAYMRTKTQALLKHESDMHTANPDHPIKSYSHAGFVESQCLKVFVGGRQFIIASTNLFHILMHKVLPEAVEKYAEYFGGNDAFKVLEAIYRTTPEGSFENFPEFLRLGGCAYVFEIKGDKIIDKVLRLDLFRNIKDDNKGNTDFIGGIFHVLRHFRFNNNPLSTSKKEANELSHPSYIMKAIIDGFFFHELIPAGIKSSFSSKVSLGEGRFLKFVFYFEEVSKIYFISTANREDDRKLRKQIKKVQ